MIWEVKNRQIPLAGQPLLMGILNVTPDSFSDGGKHATVQAAVDFALKMVEQGAAILDIGGESTRPGSKPVSLEEERRRVLPVLESLSNKTQALMSIDTTKAALAREALQVGAHIINDISAMDFDPEMMGVAKESTCGLILMHTSGKPETMQVKPHYENAPREVKSYLSAKVDALQREGIRQERMVLDPGIGFGKTYEHNLALLASLRDFQEIGRPICLGVSRKKFLQSLLGRGVEDRLAGTLGVLAYCALRKTAQIFRVHDVWQAADLLRAMKALEEHPQAEF